MLKTIKKLFSKKQTVTTDDVNKPKQEVKKKKVTKLDEFMRARTNATKQRKRDIYKHRMHKFNFGNFSPLKPFQVKGGFIFNKDE